MTVVTERSMYDVFVRCVCVHGGRIRSVGAKTINACERRCCNISIKKVLDVIYSSRAS